VRELVSDQMRFHPSRLKGEAKLASGSGGFDAVTDVIAARAKSFSACRAMTDVFVADGAATDVAQGNGGSGALDGPLGSECAGDDAIAPTFGLNDQAHDYPPK
jgi:hypothetical protein